MSETHRNDIAKLYLDTVAKAHTNATNQDIKRWDEIGGPTPENYKPDNDSAKIKESRKIRRESFSDWRGELFEDPGFKTEKDADKKISEKKGINNTVTINPKLHEAIKELGGEVVSVQEEVDCDCEGCGQDPCVKCGQSHHHITEKKGDKFYDGSDRNKNTGLPKGLKPPIRTEKEVDKKLDRTLLGQSYDPEGDMVSELNRYEKETGKSKRNEPDSAVNLVRRMIRKETGKPEGQRKKERGRKPPVAGEYGARKSPEQIVKDRRASKADAEASMRDTRGT